MTVSVLWHRLDAPGHDACRLERTSAGWRIEGTAVFCEEEVAARLDYQVECNSEWVTQLGRVRGWLGAQSIDLAIARTAAGAWTLNGAAVSGLEHCVDLDLGFTPATNMLQIRRLALAEGQAADAPAAWLDFAAGTLELLRQRYERRTRVTYWYEAPRFAYSALLEVTRAGFVRVYPGLWELES